MSVESLLEKLLIAEKAGKLPKVVIPVHLCGLPCDMEKIHALSLKYGFKVIEDASHAIGGKYQNKPIGNCEFSDITVFSFHPVKIITTGEGGMAVTNDDVLANKLFLLRSHGITRDAAQMLHEPHGPWYYEQIGLGFNYRMTDLQAALGLSQIQRLDEFVAKRHEIAECYNNNLAALPIITPVKLSVSYSALHLYVIRLKLDAINSTHRQVFQALRAADIGVNMHYMPIYKQPYYAELGFVNNACAEAEKYYDTAISIPMYFGLNDEMQAKVIDTLKTIL
jgi:dTDP-4-amino-4,6-dideoxygalactose transaminase